MHHHQNTDDSAIPFCIHKQHTKLAGSRITGPACWSTWHCRRPAFGILVQGQRPPGGLHEPDLPGGVSFPRRGAHPGTQPHLRRPTGPAEPGYIHQGWLRRTGVMLLHPCERPTLSLKSSPPSPSPHFPVPCIVCPFPFSLLWSANRSGVRFPALQLPSSVNFQKLSWSGEKVAERRLTHRR